MINSILHRVKAIRASYILIILLLLTSVLGWMEKAQTHTVNGPVLTGSEVHDISLADAVSLTRNYRTAVAPGSILLTFA